MAWSFNAFCKSTDKFEDLNELLTYRRHIKLQQDAFWCPRNGDNMKIQVFEIFIHNIF